MRAQLGQTLAEMALGTAVVAIVTIPVITVLGGVASDMFANTMHNQPKPLVVVVPPQTTPGPVPATPPTVIPPAPPGATTLPPVATPPGSVTVTLSDGSVLTLPNYPKNISNVVETSGANGATDLLLAQLDAMVQQLVDQGNADPETISRLTELANLGHRMATAEGMIEKALSTAANASDYSAKTFTFEGKTYSAEAFGKMLGWDIVVPGTLTSPLSTKNAQGFLADFLGAYDDAKSAGKLTDPALNLVVTDLVSKISSMSEYVEDANWGIVSSGATPWNQQVSIASNSTHLNSAGICSAGGGTDGGVQCH